VGAAQAALLLVSVAALVCLITLLAVSNRRIRQEQLRTRLALSDALDARGAAEGRLYGTQVLLAHSAIAALQFGQASRALDAADPALRGWEWRYLDAAANRRVPSLSVPEVPRRLRFSSDGASILCAGDEAFRLNVKSPGKTTQTHCDNGYAVFDNDPRPNFTVTPDHKLAAVQDRAGLFLWEPGTGVRTSLMPLPLDPGPEHFAPVMLALAFSPDQSLLFSAGNRELTCWDVRSREKRWSLPLASPDCWAIAVSRDAKRLAVGMEDAMAHVFDIEARKEIFHGTRLQNRPNHIEFVDDAGTRMIVCADWASPQLWDIASNHQLLNLNGSAWTTTALSPDRRLAATGCSDGDVIVWDTAAGKTLHVLHGDPEFINVVRFSPDASLLACGGRNRTVRLWNVAAGKLVKELVGHTDDIVGLDFSPDGKRLASGSRAARDGIKLWDVAAPTTPCRLPSDINSYWAWALMPDGRTLIAGGLDNQPDRRAIIDVFDLESGTRLRRITAACDRGMTAIALDPSAASLLAAAGDGSVRIYDTATGREIRVLRPADPGPYPDVKAISSAALAPDGKSVTVGTNDGWVLNLAADGGKELWHARRMMSQDRSEQDVTADMSDPALIATRVTDVRYVHGGDWLLTTAWLGGWSSAVAIYDARTGRRIYVSPRFDKTAALSPGGHVLAFGACGQGEQAEVATIDMTQTPPAPRSPIHLVSTMQNPPTINAMAFSPDTRTLAVGRGADVELYDVPSGTPKSVLHGHESTVSTLAWLPDGSRLISGGWDHTAIVWDPQRGQALLNLPLGGTLADRVEHLLVTPDGSRIIGTNAFPDAGSGGNTIIVWTAPTR
jgi:WD40 repeat protein